MSYGGPYLPCPLCGVVLRAPAIWYHLAGQHCPRNSAADLPFRACWCRDFTIGEYTQPSKISNWQRHVEAHGGIETHFLASKLETS